LGSGFDSFSLGLSVAADDDFDLLLLRTNEEDELLEYCLVNERVCLIGCACVGRF
jgi:hypothetical protein